jgi:hypothetical protein
VPWLALAGIALFSLLMLKGQTYSLFCRGVKSLLPTFRNGGQQKSNVYDIALILLFWTVQIQATNGTYFSEVCS